MNERIRKHIDELFKDAPRTRKAMEWKEEVIINTIEKYQDLIGEGYQEEDAWQIVINSIGDVTELFQELKEENPWNLSEELRKKKAVMKTVAAGLYILAVVVCLSWTFFSERYFYMEPEMGVIGVLLGILICIAPTCMLVYAANMYPEFHKKNDDILESYKEFRYARNREKAVKTSVSVIIWLMTLILYFAISFVTLRWEVSWITFLVGGCIQAIAVLLFSLKQEK